MKSRSYTTRIARLRPWRLVFAVLLVLPPCLRWATAYLDPRPAAGSTLNASEDAALRAELATVRFELERLRARSEMLSHATWPGGYERITAEVLPLSDPSPRRRAVWVYSPGPRAVPRDTPVLSLERAPVLVGRTHRPIPGAPLVRIESLLDPAFRVRFRHQGASGILWGTGSEAGGHPVLEIKHLSELVELKEGEPVFTEGRDGVYPEGVLIGHVEREAGGSRLVVKASAALESIEQVVLAVDLTRESLARVRSELEGRPR